MKPEEKLDKNGTNDYYESISVKGIGIREVDLDKMMYCKECDLWIYKKFRNHIHRQIK